MYRDYYCPQKDGQPILFWREKVNNNHDHQAMQDQAQSELASVFEKMPNEISLILITSTTKNEQFNDAARQIIRSIRTFTSKVTLKEFDITHDIAKKYNVEFTPTILFEPDNYNIRWLGAPLGEEGRIFVEALIMLGYKMVQLSEASQKVLDKIESKRDMKVFISPT